MSLIAFNQWQCFGVLFNFIGHQQPEVANHRYKFFSESLKI